MSFRVEYASKVRGTYEIYRVSHGFDIECYLTNVLGEVLEAWDLDHENGTDVRKDVSNLAGIKSELRDLIKEFEADREPLEPINYRELLFGPYKPPYFVPGGPFINLSIKENL